MVMKSRAEKLNLEFSILRQCDDLTHSAYKLYMSSNHICMYFHELHLKKISFIRITKGQLISKCLFGVFNSSKKRTKTIRLEVPLVYHSSKVEFFSFFFWEN